MRHRFGICAAASCVGSTLLALASCEDSSSSSGPGLNLDGSTPSFDGSVPGDAGTIDSGIDTGVDAGCTPWTLDGFTVPAYVPAREHQFSCFNGEYEPYAEACVGDASTLEACANFGARGDDGGPIDEGCARCLDPLNNDAGPGPVIKGSVFAPNLAGCVEHAIEGDAGFDCAKSIATAAACVEHVCKPSCTVTDEPSRAAYLACTKVAATGVCATYAQAAAACVAPELDAGNYELNRFCFPADGTPVAQFSQIARFFCLS